MRLCLLFNIRPARGCAPHLRLQLLLNLTERLFQLAFRLSWCGIPVSSVACLCLHSPLNVTLSVLGLLLAKPERVVLLLTFCVLVKILLGNSGCLFVIEGCAVKTKLEVVLAKIGSRILEETHGLLHAFAHGGSFGSLVRPESVLSPHPHVLLPLLRSVTFSLVPDHVLTWWVVDFQVRLIG